MLNSMTGFCCVRGELKNMGRVELQLRSINHRFLEIVFHLPENSLYLEDSLREIIAKQIKRGRVTCNLKLNGPTAPRSAINKQALRSYLTQLKQLSRELNLKAQVNLETLLSLPGVLAGQPVEPQLSLRALKGLFAEALERLVAQRKKEGLVLYQDLKKRCQRLNNYANKLQQRFKNVIAQKLKGFAVPEEQVNFLKSTDITEELVRLRFHLKNFTHNMQKAHPLGKELDFIAQEMMRETNTIGAKSIDARMSNYVVQIKSEIEKLREQLQNIE